MKIRQAKKDVAKLANQFRDRNCLTRQYDWNKLKKRAEEVHDATHVYTGLSVEPNQEILLVTFQLALAGYSWFEIEEYWKIAESLSYFPGWEKIREWFLKSFDSHPSWVIVMNQYYSIVELL